MNSAGGPAHVSAQHLPEISSSYLHASNYLGSTYVVFRLSVDDGSIQEMVYEEHYGKGTGVVMPNQEWAHPHGAFFNGPYVYVVDLGGDRIMVYEAKANGHIIKLQQFDMPVPGIHNKAITKSMLYIALFILYYRRSRAQTLGHC